MQKPYQWKWVSGLAITLLAAIAFTGGRYLGPRQEIGHDLFRTGAAQSTAGPNSSRGLLLTGMSNGMRVAASQAEGLSGSSRRDATPPSESDPGATFQDVYTALQRNYVEGVPDDSKMSHGAVTTMLASLQDPSTRFLEADEFAEAKREMQGQFAGIGAVMDIRTTVAPKDKDDPTRDKNHPTNTSYALTVVSTLPGSPAEKAGLKTGDVITDINGQWVATYDLVSAQAKALKAAQDKNDPVALNKMIDALQKKLDNALTLPQAQTKLRDPNAKTLTLTVSRPEAAQPLTIAVEPTTGINLPMITGKMLSEGNAYIKIGYLNAGTGAAFANELTTLGPNIKGLIIDLRNTTGGTPEEATEIAAKVSTVSTLGLRLGKGLKTTPILVTPAKAVAGPVVVLINSGTDGASELLASALKTGGAKLIGSTTFGDDKDVRPVSLPDGSGFTMTYGLLLTASGGRFGGTGIAPDITVPESGTDDAVLMRAITELSGRVARAE